MASSPNQVVIGVFGMRGAGKSTFINTVTGRNDARIGHDLASETATCQAYSFKASNDLSFSLIDTPGFNDPFLDDDEIFMQVAEFMKTTYQSHVKLTAVFYLHPIHHERLERSSLCHLSMFKELCGPDYYKHMVLATTFWTKVERHIGVKRQEELVQKDEFWGKLKRQGAEVIELPDDRQLCIEMLLRLARRHNAAPLQVQVELVDKGLTIRQTKASQMIELNKQIAVEEAKFAEAFANISLQKDLELATQRRQREHELDKHLRRLQELSEGNRELEGMVVVLTNILKSENPMRLAVQQAREWRIENELEEKRLRYRRQLNEFRIIARRQDVVLSEAKRLGHVKMGITPRVASRSCDICYQTFGIQLSYSHHCDQCNDWDVCPKCFDNGSRCLGENHAFSNLTSPQAPYFNAVYRNVDYLICNSCRRNITTGSLFYHCEKCASGHFDLCLDCLVAGKTCNRIFSRLHTMQEYLL